MGANAQQAGVASLKDTLSKVEAALQRTRRHRHRAADDEPVQQLLRPVRQPRKRRDPLHRTQSGGVSCRRVSLGQHGPERHHAGIASKINVTVDTVNNIAGQIAALNKEISLSVAAGQQPNDLLDKRGQLVDQLSGYVDVQVIDQKNTDTGKPTGKININIGGYALVQDNTANTLPKTIMTDYNVLGLTTPTGDAIPLRGGQLYGLVKATTLIKGYQSDLDTLAYNVVNATNQLHLNGYGLDGTTNNAFFAPLTAADGAAAAISVDPGVEADLNKIAASTPPTPPAQFAPGNGDNARAIAALVSNPVIGNSSLDSYYNAKVAAIGADSKTFQQQTDNQDKIVSQLKTQQSSISGVNLDEELTRMLQYQRAYQAAARMINTADAFLDKIINGLGAGGP